MLSCSDCLPEFLNQGRIMLRFVLGVGRDEITYEQVISFLKTGTREAAVEGNHLDFKSELPSDKKGRFKIARAIAAFANSSGGLLICGVEDDKNDRAAKLTHVQLDSTVADLRRSLNQHLSPAPPFSFIPVGKGDGEGLLLIEVLPSSLAPHAAYEDARPEFPVRRGIENTHMTEQELERAYRARFGAITDTDSRISKIWERVRATCPHGAMWLSATPQDRGRRVYLGPRDGHDRFGELVKTGALYGPPNFRLGGSRYRTRAQRVVCDEPSNELFNFCQLSDRGEFDGWFPLDSIKGLQESKEYEWISELGLSPSSRLGRQQLFGNLLLLLRVLRDVMKHFDCWTSLRVSLGIHHGSGVVWVAHPSELPGDHPFLVEPVQLEWTLSLSDLLTPGYLERLTGDAFEELAAAFGLLQDPVVSREGQLYVATLKGVGRDWYAERDLSAI